MDFKVISLSDRAAERIAAIVARSETPVAGLRVGVKNAGCAGMEYTLDYVTEPVEGDDHVRDKDVDIYVDPRATLFLLGTEMDYGEQKLKSGFVFNNPNQTGACGCGESVELQKADLESLARARAGG